MSNSNSLKTITILAFTILFSFSSKAQNDCRPFIYGFIDENYYMLQSDVRFSSNIIVFMPSNLSMNDSIVESKILEYIDIITASKTQSDLMKSIENHHFVFYKQDEFCKEKILQNISKKIIFKKEFIINNKKYTFVKLTIL